MMLVTVDMEDVETVADMAERLANEYQEHGDDFYTFTKCATRLDRTGPYHKEDVVAALIASDFTLSVAASLLGRNRSRFRDFVFGNPDVLELYHDTRAGVLDMVEQQVFRSAMRGDVPAAKFLLSTLGKDRGYNTRQELSGVDGESISFAPTVIRLVGPDDEVDEEFGSTN